MEKKDPENHAFNTTKINQANFAGIMACSSLTFKTQWIIDTGASDHMCHDDTLLSNIQLLSKPISIGLPNGHVISVYKFGTMVLNHKLSL